LLFTIFLKMNTSIGRKLRTLRKQKGITQEQAADYLQLSQSAYARMESGDSYSWANHIDKLCEFYEIQPEELLKGEKLIIGNIGTNNGVGYAEIVNQLSEKLIEQFEARLLEKENRIKYLEEKLNNTKQK
jgi:transcriptional regulator with XRE-family HTH domain